MMTKKHRLRLSTSLALAERFWLRVEKTDGCWLWTGGTGNGAPIFHTSVPPLTVKAHRLAWALTYGAVPVGELVEHLCGNALCVRPDHLYLAGSERGLTKRFWDQVQKSDGCWLWVGFRDPNGYGHIGLPHSGKHMLAHRLSYILYHGALPDDACVLHKCDNPRCVRPEHLYLGDRMDNAIDKVSRGRHLIGEQHGEAKLTADQVLEIRRRYAAGGISQYALAAEYGVKRSTISHITVGTSWRHLPLPNDERPS